MKNPAWDQNISETYLELTCHHLPMVKKIIDTYGDMPLLEYAQILIPKPGIKTYQSQKDVLKVVYDYVKPLLGESVAQQTVKDLDTYPVILTASHHGVEYFSQTFQARLIFSLNVLKQRIPTSTIPVFACGNIPLNNAVYPRGALIYQVAPEAFEAIPIKLPLFPDRLKRSVVSSAPGFDLEMIDRTSSKANQMVKAKKISSLISDPLHHIFQKNYGSESVVHLPTYSDQSVVVNHLIWKQLFPQFESVPNSICLEFEKISGSLIKIDLLNPQSLLWFILFDPELRRHLLSELDGINGCWNQEALEYQQSVSTPDKQHDISMAQCGTIFFWGVDDKGRKLSLNIKTNDAHIPVFSGIDDNGNLWEWPYSQEAIIDGISKGRLLPSVFLCFVVLLFARGLACVGGYFQGIYLPAMKKGLISALKKIQKYENLIALIVQVKTDYYLDGMQAVMARINNKYMVPAGPLEIIANGGITTSDIDKMSTLTVREAHLADMFETIQDAVPARTLPLGWKKLLSADIYQLLSHKVVVK
ncbi:hypothetical protein [Desulfobacula sp.]|uniref:hypothetical protein n=1 Tax=Desulfobacula sp. TaxID=2593537 RepID=UPI002603F52E|nr:hypothetical protein [Desulfobacula sp.]